MALGITWIFAPAAPTRLASCRGTRTINSCRDFKEARLRQRFSIETAAPPDLADTALNNILRLEPMLPPRFLTALRHAVYHFNKTTHMIVPVKLCFGSFSAILTQSSS